MHQLILMAPDISVGHDKLDNIHPNSIAHIMKNSKQKLMWCLKDSAAAQIQK